MNIMSPKNNDEERKEEEKKGEEEGNFLSLQLNYPFSVNELNHRKEVHCLSARLLQ